jgi:putative salt-induced outer membrane protein YdiY
LAARNALLSISSLNPQGGTPMTCIRFFACAALVAAPVFAFADDTVWLRNGDRLSGTVLNLSAETLRLATSYAGELTIRRADVAAMRTGDAVPITLDGAVVTGRLAEAGEGQVTVTREDGSAETMPLERIAYVNPTPRQGGPGVSYGGRVNLGYSRSAGNSDNERLYGDGELRVRHRDYRWAVGGEARESKDDGVTSESNWLARGSYDRFVRPREFLYARSTLEHDEFRDIDLRTTVGAGYGFQAIETDTTRLSLQAGVDYVNIQRVVAADEEYPAAGWGISFDHRLWDGKVELFLNQEGFWSLEDSDDVLARTRTGLRFPLGGGFNATAQLNLDWDNEPAPGRESTDETWLFTLGYAW